MRLIRDRLSKAVEKTAVASSAKDAAAGICQLRQEARLAFADLAELVDLPHRTTYFQAVRLERAGLSFFDPGAESRIAGCRWIAYLRAIFYNSNMQHLAKIFSGTGSQYLAEKIAHQFGHPAGKVTIQRFSDGEIQPIFNESIRGDMVFLVQSTCSPAENLLELLLMIDAARRASAYKVVAVIPYYGYARQDRKDKPRVAIGSKLIANMLVSAGADRVITMDLHAAQIQGYFDIPVDHLDSSAIFIPYIEQLKMENLTFAAPDVGSANRVREIASYFNAEMVICDKHRKRANEIASMVVIGDVADKISY
jgi:ribose-phosphate pyrophosphokinase